MNLTTSDLDSRISKAKNEDVRLALIELRDLAASRPDPSPWIPAERIGDYPELHSSILPNHKEVPLLLVSKNWKPVVSGVYWANLDEFNASGYSHAEQVTYFMPMPKKPEETK